MIAFLAYQFMRGVTWLLWLGFLGYCAYFLYDRGPHLNQFGHLTHLTEAVMFGLPLAAVCAGMFQLMLRDMVKK
jgi:hypothetical protein